MHTTLVAAGRIVLGLVFVIHALLYIKGGIDAGNLNGLAGYISSRGLPMPMIIAYAVLAFEIICGLAIIFNYFTSPIALVLAAFCVAAAVIFHAFWSMPADKFPLEVQFFLKDIGLAAAFLLLAGEGIRVRANPHS